MMTATNPAYTHVGARGYTGHYAVTTDAIRTPGRRHALNVIPGSRDYLSLCGVRVHYQSDDHQVDTNPVVPAAEGAITCTRCRQALGLLRWEVQVPRWSGRGWVRVAACEPFATREEAEAALRERQQLYPRQVYRVARA